MPLTCEKNLFEVDYGRVVGLPVGDRWWRTEPAPGDPDPWEWWRQGPSHCFYLAYIECTDPVKLPALWRGAMRRFRPDLLFPLKVIGFCESAQGMRAVDRFGWHRQGRWTIGEYADERALMRLSAAGFR